MSTRWRFERYRTAYLAMAVSAKYRPAAPSDGFGNIQLTEHELRDAARLQDEAKLYARDFLAQDDAMEYPIGCPDGRGNRAFCYLIEAARAICSGDDILAKRLVDMARKELTIEYPKGLLHGRS